MEEKTMRMYTVLVGVGCLVIGLLASAFTPQLTAQTTPEPCQAPWDVTIGAERPHGSSSNAGWHAVKWNRCTGETFVYATSRHDTNTTWTKNPVQ